MSRESTTRWADNGLPRKGWQIESVTELERGSESSCDWCGTTIRFVYGMVHPDHIDTPTDAGCVCAGALIQDYALATQAKKDFYAKRAKERREARKAETAAWRALEKRRAWLTEGWHRSDAGNAVKRFRGSNVTVFQNGYTQRRVAWVYAGEFSPEKFHDEHGAMLDFYQRFVVD